MGNPLLSSCLTDGLIRWSTSVTRQLALLQSYKYERTLKQLRESTNASFMESSQIGSAFSQLLVLLLHVLASASYRKITFRQIYHGEFLRK
ncbi:hypothetical protein TNIN_465531 [Trichonephila inaurata madagascariensis]|uniref:Uncharacterized protein n=1 Tax=Trichonephila inaurata madagascariensis TaxID=2747483 RepID=A0A8X7CLH7_9ARAC|nr:hypothetical protein TNIN_465531 [Trichonephila inaurata madagascariensis]